jgi:quercetin dioxygenase-like cupin family protein
MRLTPSTRPTTLGPSDSFTGTVFLDPVREPDKQSAIASVHVRFTPGSRTAWHSHPHGQTIYVTDGIGYAGTRDGTVLEFHPGDVVYFEPNEEHWHGATHDRFMSHLAMQEADENGTTVTWLEHVTDEQYTA